MAIRAITELFLNEKLSLVGELQSRMFICQDREIIACFDRYFDQEENARSCSISPHDQDLSTSSFSGSERPSPSPIIDIIKESSSFLFEPISQIVAESGGDSPSRLEPISI